MKQIRRFLGELRDAIAQAAFSRLAQAAALLTISGNRIAS